MRVPVHVDLVVEVLDQVGWGGVVAVRVLLEMSDQVGRGVAVQEPESVGVGIGVELFQPGQQAVTPPVG